MLTHTVLIADDNQAWCLSLIECLAQSPVLRLLPPVNSGSDAIERIEQARPDIIITDLVLPVYDGLYIINYIHRQIQRYDPIIYVLSAIDAEKTSKVMRAICADYYSIKPIAQSAVLDNLHSLILLRSGGECPQRKRESGRINLEQLVDNYLSELGAPLYRVSTRSLRLALRLALEDESLLKSSMELYRRVGRHESADTQSAYAPERNIRIAIKAIQDNDSACLRKYFPDQRKRITNTQFLNRSVYLLKLRMQAMSSTPGARDEPVV